jgi:hypothetical protein
MFLLTIAGFSTREMVDASHLFRCSNRECCRDAGRDTALSCVRGSSEGLSAGARPEELAKILAGELGPVIPFEHLDVVVLKENCCEIEYHAWGKAEWPVPDLPIEKLLTWHVHNSQEPLQITDWNTDERVSEQLKDVAKTIDISVGSALLVPLTPPPQATRYSTLGIASALGITYTSDDIAFLRRLDFRADVFIVLPVSQKRTGQRRQVAVH